MELSDLLKELDKAYASGNTTNINRINDEINKVLGNVVTESAVDFDFINNIKGKSVYLSLTKVCKGAEIANEDVMKLMSSLVTHMIIECKQNNKEYKDYPIKSILSSLQKLVGDGGDINESKKFIRDRYSRYI